METPAETHSQACTLRRHIHRFMRSFGLLITERTPCGQPLPVSHAHALMILKEHTRQSPALSMGELAQRLMIDKSNVTRLCRRMEEQGHIKLLSSSTDRRVRRLGLTSSGSRLAGQVETGSRRRFQKIVQAMSREECSGLLRGLDALNRAVQQTAQETNP